MVEFKEYIGQIFTSKRIVSGIIVLFAVFTIIVIFDQVIMPWYTKHGEAHAVPAVVAKRYEAAREILETQGLKAIKAGEKHDPNLPFGYVVEQNPRANRLVKKDRRVYLTISVGEREIQTPNLVGLSENNARERLKSVSLRLGEVDYEYIPNELADVVVAQSESPTTLVKVNSVIKITVSLGKPTANVTVPSVFGKTLGAAKREIKKAGLVVGQISYRISEQFLPSTVINQSLEVGMIVRHGEPLDLLVTVVSNQEP